MCFLSLFFWKYIIDLYDIQTAYYAGGSVFTVALVMLYVVTPETNWLLWPTSVVAGFGLGVCYLVPWSMLPNVIEQDELTTGKRREGIFYGFFILVQKLGLGIGLAISSMLLGVAGYAQPAATCGNNKLVTKDIQNESVLEMLRVMVSFIPAALMLLSFIPVYMYPISKESHAATVKALEERHQSTRRAVEAPSDVPAPDTATQIPDHDLETNRETREKEA